jgi:hypothetical protein
VTKPAKKTVTLNVTGTDQELTGSKRCGFANQLFVDLMNTVRQHDNDEEKSLEAMQAAADAMAGIAPRDETEGMLAAQMVACHLASMECFRRAMLPNQPLQARQLNLNYGGKLARTYALHMEALDKHRGKGQQTVRVEHVTVNAGGQAIVGAVNQSPVGGGTSKPKERPHAESHTHAPEPAMRSPLAADRQAMPKRRDEEW